MRGLSEDELSDQRVRWEARLDPFACPDPYFFEGSLKVPYPDDSLFQPMDTARELLARPRARLSPPAARLLQAGLAQVALEPTPHDAGLLPQPGVAWLRSPFSDLPLDRCAKEHAQGRRRAHTERLQAHRYWVRADITNLTGTLDRGLLVQSLRLPKLRPLFEHLGLGPRRGIRTCGRATHVLARVYLDPVVKGFTGYNFLHTDLDEFHFYVDSRVEAGLALDRLTRLLEPLALHLNYQKTFVISARQAQTQEVLARFQPSFVRHRLAAAASDSLHPWVVRTLAEPLYSEAFLHRRPGYRQLLRTPAGRAAFELRLADPHLLPGDRARLELFRA